MRRKSTSWAVTALLLAAAGLPAAGAAEVKHSGRIVATAADGKTITVEEVGPWTKGNLTLVKHPIALEPGTKIEMVSRAETGAQWPGGFKEASLSASDLRVDDYVTVTAESRGGRLVATSVQVIRPGTGASDKPPGPHAQLSGGRK